MLALKANRVSLKMIVEVGRYNSIRPCGSVPFSGAIFSSGTRYEMQPGLGSGNLMSSRAVIAPFIISANRFYAMRQPPPPAQASSGLPDKEQLEKYFFKVVVIMWDLCTWLYAFSLRTIDKYVVQNPKVQEYWQQFVKKVEEARKN